MHIHADIDAHIHTCTRSYMRNPTYMQTYMRTHSYNVIHIHRSHTLLHTHSSSHLPLTHGLIHTHTLKLIHALTRKHTYMHTYMPLIILITLPSSHSTHLTHLISLNSSHLCSYIYFFIFIYPSPLCFFIKLLTCGVIRSYNLT